MTEAMGHRGYISSRRINNNRVPQHVQNIVVRNYAERHGIGYLLSATEMSPENCFIVLNDVLDNLEFVDGIIMFSLFMMPKEASARHEIYKRVLDEGKSLHAAVEGISIESEIDVERTETLFQITGILDNCLTPEEIFSGFSNPPTPENC